MQESQEPKSNLSDIGTRYEHLCDYRDDIAICVQLLKDRGLDTLAEKQRFAKFTVALEVITTTIDSFAGFKDARSEFKLYQQISAIPADPESIPSTRGTPLI